MVEFKADWDLSEEEKDYYYDQAMAARAANPKTEGEITKITLKTLSHDSVKLDFATAPVKFERIRRITGYLTGTVDRWNEAKKAELYDRVKHA